MGSGPAAAQKPVLQSLFMCRTAAGRRRPSDYPLGVYRHGPACDAGRPAGCRAHRARRRGVFRTAVTVART
eukprot:scaffold232_cov140-Isochrysis_galbana.AAC.4